MIDDFDLNDGDRSTHGDVAVPPPIVSIQTAPPTSQSSETSIWRRLSSWAIYVDHTLHDGCFALASFNNNTVFRVGVSRKAGGKYYLVFGNPDWESLRSGQDYHLELRFDNNSPWDAPATAVDMHGSTFLKVLFSDPQFWNEFTASQTLSITKEGKAVISLNMIGAKAAFDELASCQRYEDAQSRSRDPFAQ